jgi:putative sporulation protein YtaF
MHLFSIILISLGANLDNLSIGLSYGMRKIRIPIIAIIIISLLSGLFTLISCLAGHLLSDVIPNYFSNIIGGGIIIFVGVWIITASFLKNKRKIKEDIKNRQEAISSEKPPNTEVDGLIEIIQDPDKADRDGSGDISIKESILLGIALAINCLATGFGAGMTGVNVYAISAATALFSLITILLGLKIGIWCQKYLSGKKADIISGILLIIIGLYEIFL